MIYENNYRKLAIFVYMSSFEPVEFWDGGFAPITDEYILDEVSVAVLSAMELLLSNDVVSSSPNKDNPLPPIVPAALVTLLWSILLVDEGTLYKLCLLVDVDPPVLLLLFKPLDNCSDLEKCGRAEKPVDVWGLIAEFNIVLLVCRPFVGRNDDGTGDLKGLLIRLIHIKRNWTC